MNKYFSEFIGTFFLVFLGCGAIIQNQMEPVFMPGYMIPFVFGITVSTMVYAVGHISGAHFNPAVTAAFAITRKFPLKDIPGYIFAQCLGAIAASSLHIWFWGAEHNDLGMTYFHVDLVTAIGLEILLSFLLMFVITSVATDTRAVGELAGLAIGSTVAIAAWVGGPMTGASMNPARSLGPALLAGDFEHLFVYLTAPFVGATLGALAYRFACHDKSKITDSKCC